MLEEVVREVFWSILELPGLGEGQMLVEHPDGESEIEYNEKEINDGPAQGAVAAFAVHPHPGAGRGGWGAPAFVEHVRAAVSEFTLP